MFRFEKLDVWKRSTEFADRVYRTTSKFPAKEQFGITSQLRRAAVSISANIAEGSSRTSGKDFSRFIELSYGSLCEVVSHLYVAKLQRLISDDSYVELYSAAEDLGRMLSAFRNGLNKWKATDQPNG